MPPHTQTTGSANCACAFGQRNNNQSWCISPAASDSDTGFWTCLYCPARMSGRRVSGEDRFVRRSPPIFTPLRSDLSGGIQCSFHQRGVRLVGTDGCLRVKGSTGQSHGTAFQPVSPLNRSSSRRQEAPTPLSRNGMSLLTSAATRFRGTSDAILGAHRVINGGNGKHKKS